MTLLPRDLAALSAYSNPLHFSRRTFVRRKRRNRPCGCTNKKQATGSSLVGIWHQARTCITIACSI
jgi:hypothetical protein